MAVSGMLERPVLWIIVVAGAIVAAALNSASSLRLVSRGAQVQVVRPLSPEGWLGDSTCRHELRYWDGTVWTDRVRDAEEDSEDSLRLTDTLGRFARGVSASRSTGSELHLLRLDIVLSSGLG